MNNGLHGRYLPALKAWNNARRFASELAAAYFDGDSSVADVLNEWRLQRQEVELPSLDEIKQMVSNVIFLDGRDSVDIIAQKVMSWSGWRDVENPGEYESIERETAPAASKVVA